MLQRNPSGNNPEIDNTAYIHPSAVIIGNVVIGKNVFVGPGAVIRADEQSSSILIQDNCNIQDRVIIHALENSSVTIEQNSSLAHGCIVHGPCKIARNCFIGFGSIVFKAEIGEGVVIKHLAVVEGVIIPPERVVESTQLINNDNDVKGLKFTENDLKIFSKKVVEVNLNLAKSYRDA